jgi:hypothetical protein
MTNQKLIDFYRGIGSDAAGRTIAQVLQFDHRRLEGVHDYIQWLFPTAKASQFNPNAPLLDDETIAVFREDILIQERLQQSLAVMLEFYGLHMRVGEDCITIRKGPNYAARKGNWQNAPAGQLNHNLLRLTRILECLTAVGMENYAVALYGCLASIAQEEPEKIPVRTVSFWQQACAVDGAF